MSLSAATIRFIPLLMLQASRFLAVLCLLLPLSAQAQLDASHSHDVKAADSSGVKGINKHDRDEQKDITDVARRVFGGSKKISAKLFKPDSIKSADSLFRKSGKLHVSVLPGAGYTLQTRFAGAIAANGAFYTDESEHANLSVVNAIVAYTQNQQVILPIQSNIWTKGNKFNLLGDWRFYRYPQFTYGLGGHTTLADADQMNYEFVTIHQTVAKQVAKDLLVGVGYNFDYHWNITEEGYADGRISDYQRYGKTKNSLSTGPSLSVLYDDRRNAIYPLKGYYANIVYRPNLVALGSDQNWQSLLIDVRRYIKVPGYKNSSGAMPG
jgi:hypothetical protein